MDFVRGAAASMDTKAPPGSLAKDWTSCSCLFGDPRGVLVRGAVVRLKTQDAFSGEYGDVDQYDDVQRKWLVRLHRREVAIAPMSFSYVELHFAYRVMLGDASGVPSRSTQPYATGDVVFVEAPCVLVGPDAPARWRAAVALKARAKAGDAAAREAVARLEALAPPEPAWSGCAACGARARVQCPRRCGLTFCGRACQRSSDARGHADGCGPFDARTRRLREARAVVDDYKTRKTRSFRKKQSAATYDAKVRKVATCLRRFEVCARQPWAACAAGTAVYAGAAALPHACAPALRMVIDDGTLTATAARDLAENQLLTVNLGPPQLPEWGRDVRRRWLRDHHGFACECATCARDDAKQAARAARAAGAASRKVDAARAAARAGKARQPAAAPAPPPPPAPPKLEDLPPHLHTLGALEDHLAAEEASRRATDAYLAEHYAESSSGESDIDWRAEVPRKW